MEGEGQFPTPLPLRVLGAARGSSYKSIYRSINASWSGSSVARVVVAAAASWWCSEHAPLRPPSFPFPRLAPPHSPSRPVRPAAAGSPSARTHTYTLPHIGSRCARSHSTSTSEGVLTRECRPRIYFAFFSCLLCVYGHRVQCKEVPPCLRSKGLEC